MAPRTMRRPGRVLIDDNDTNCAKWREHGGTAILFPQPWNSDHTKVSERIHVVGERLVEAMQ